MEELFETARNLDYSEPSIVANAIKEVRKCFPLFEYKVNTHAKAVPVEIWLPLDFPRHPPILRVPLVRTMLINPSGHVNIIGNIEHVSLNQWNQDSRLVDLLYTLTVEFMDVFPVFELGHFNLPSKAKDVIFAVMRKYQRLKLFWDKHSPDGSKQTIELKLEGLIPLDKRPDIAVRIWLFLSFPQTAPDVYVIPGDNMALTPTVHLYKSGRVRHNYIKEWEYPTSNLTELLDQLVKAFSQNFPFQVLGEHGLPGNKQKLQQAKTLLDKLKISKKTKKVLQLESVNTDIVYPTNPPSDTLLSVTDLAPL
ncbi:hypothetical protein LSH36_142g03003 [Paralvinella palmiformis]|uniref:UEV domain-containing protein n=1 Tax=Paralvinella palmiformis TaxID=53620 RepID=A0AAD9JWG6_9ANNE|nr:hypothetical protein LSH36_142g03003 [Paralvinella palmiformis]